MSTEQSALAYQQFVRALADWWNNPGRHAFRKPELADFSIPESGERIPESGEAAADPLNESPQSERAAKPRKTQKP